MRTTPFIVAMILVLALPAGGAQRQRWPLDTPPRLSSSFGEYREGHYHAGVDLRTFGRIGLPCRAIGESEVTRLRISAKGYGKAVYMRLGDGSEVVFAHLSGFSRVLDSLAYHRRLGSGTNWCDIDLRSHGLRFEVGSVVAYTGASGSPHPHLHFEMRDSASRPFDPLASHFSVPDAEAPVISALEVVALARGSRADGSPLPLVTRFHFLGGNRYELADTLQLDGVFGFGVSAWDRQDHGSYRLGVQSIALSIDGTLAYRLVNRRLDYARTGDIVLEYDEISDTAPGRYVLLYRKPGNAMDDRDGVGAISSGTRALGVEALTLAEGYHRAEIVARDAGGNEARAAFGFNIHRYPTTLVSGPAGGVGEIEFRADDPDGGEVAVTVEESSDGGASWRGSASSERGGVVRAAARRGDGTLFRCIAIDDEGARIERYAAFPATSVDSDSASCECRLEATSGGLRARIVADRILAAVPFVCVCGSASADSCEVVQIAPREFVAFVDTMSLASGASSLCIRGTGPDGAVLAHECPFRALLLRPGVWSALRLSDGVSVRLSGQSAAGAIPVVAREAAGQRPASPDLMRIGQPFSLDFALDRVTRPILCGVEGGRGAGVYRWLGRAGWRCIGVPEREGGSVEIRRPGVYALFRDVRAPRLRDVASSRRGGGSGFFKSTLYYLPVREEGSGVDPGATTAVLNGARIVCEWDEYRRRLDIPIPASYPPGPAELAIELADRAGNRTAGRFTFVIE